MQQLSSVSFYVRLTDQMHAWKSFYTAQLFINVNHLVLESESWYIILWRVLQQRDGDINKSRLDVNDLI